ncbi:enolase C-terminal domain-like protein [Herbiconiux sp. P17]|uniref:enolase C-terminal domain-like protein n=1 Tax=Herbiconiux wuyangfengii TaxID=3342794 RepID=UPI0035BAF460
MSQIETVETFDVRFPTSQDLDGSDAMNTDPDYSAAYVVITTSAGDSGHGFVFTIGRGNDIQAAAIRSIGRVLEGRDVEQLLGDMGATWQEFVHDSQTRWLGPEKGVTHMAIGAIVNALWDLKAKRAGLPLWQLLAQMSPAELADLVDYRYLSDALTRDDALRILEAAVPGREARTAELLAGGYPAYTTSPGWLGYSDEKLARLCREAITDGFGQIKLKVGADLDDDIRRLRIAREVCGPDFPIAIDANQRWDVDAAVEWIDALRPFDLAWVEEPTSPDDVVGHSTIARRVAPIRIATGEHVANRVVFKQLLQLEGAAVVQIDASRVAGVNENVAILLLAAKFGVPVCPHAGGVGLCEAVQHLSMFDFVAITGTQDDRMIEFVDHLHEHFVTPAKVVGGRYQTPTASGAGAEMHAASIEAFLFPDGVEWAERGADADVTVVANS